MLCMVKGTGRRSGAESSYKMAGKTGTAQVLGIKQDSTYDAATIAERFRDHGLYIGWAPAKDPVIAIAVIIENGGGGSSAAAPLARKLFDLSILGAQSKTKAKEGAENDG